MEKKIIVDKVKVISNRLEVYYTVFGEIEKYFNKSEKCFWAEYTDDISSVPKSLAVIPFICNVLPIAWLADAELIVDELDEEFYHSLFEVKHGYMLLSRMLEFKGKVTVNNVVRNYYKPTMQSAVLFSGGVDAFTTLFRHLGENPLMITLRGSDIKLHDLKGWNVVKEQVETAAKTFNLPEPSFVTTNFRCFINEGVLGELVVKSGDGWWHAYQHGIGIIGHTAPLAYLYKLNKVYIASSYTCDFPVICASDPVIDSHLSLSSTEVRHDGYFMNRIDKVKFIVETCERLNKNILLRVCWISEGGHNCCECEKCIRTIFNILAVGGNPSQYGFILDKEKESKMYSIVHRCLLTTPFQRPQWHDIQDYILKTNKFKEKDNPYYSWIYQLDIDENMPKPSVARILARKIRRRLLNKFSKK